MRWIRSDRARLIVTGALLGAFIVAELDLLGVSAAMKIGFLLVPGLILGGAIGLTRARPLLWWACGLLTVTSLVAAYTPATELLMIPQYRADTIPETKLDAAIVLSGGVTEDGTMQSETLSRLIKGVWLARYEKGIPLLVSREWAPAPVPGAYIVSDEMNVLALFGLTAQTVFLDSATSTRDEALRARKIATARGWLRVAVVTSPLHTARACATFEKVGFKVTCVPSEAREFPLFRISDPGSRMAAFRNWVYEMAGTLKYRAQGWI